MGWMVMWRRRMKCIIVAVVVLLSFTFPCLSAIAEKEKFEIWLSPSGAKDIHAILWHNGTDSRYFFLPGNIDLTSYKIGFSKYDSVSINGQEIQNGVSATILLPENTLTVKDKKFPLIIMQGSPDLPSIYITTESGSLYKIHKDKANKEPGEICIYAGDGSLLLESHLRHLKTRGNSTALYPKKSYQFKLESGFNLFGMGKAKKWILLSNYLDKSLIRNEMSLDMAMYAGLQYTVEHQQCELYINNEYMGLYLLTEKIEPDDDRVDIADLEKETEELNDKELSSYSVAGTRNAKAGKFKGYIIPVNPPDITGGYIMEFEGIQKFRYREEPSAYETDREITVVVKYPEYASKEQMQYITPIIQSLENAIYAKDGKDPVTGKHLTEIIDLDSFVNKYLINEISRNYDANVSSEYFYKPEDSKSTKLFAGPVWDLDNSYANYARNDNAKKVLKSTGFFVNKATGAYFWWPAMYRQKVFYDRVVEQYRDVFSSAIDILLGNKKDSNGKLLSLDEYEARISDSVAMNYVRYPKMRYKNGNVQTGRNLHENIEYLRTFLTERKAFLDEVWSSSD